MKKAIAVCVVVWGSLGFANSANADVVTDWSVIATQALSVAGVRQGPAAGIDLAMVHLAIHDAIQAFQHRFETYADPVPNASGSPIAAAATAAHDVLKGVGIVSSPQGTIDSLYMAYLTSHSLLGDPGIVVGQLAAANILNLRIGNDGRAPANAEQFLGGTGAGEWRPTAVIPGTSNPQPMVAAFLAHVLPFALKDPSQFRASPPPPDLPSGEYARDYEEVKRMGVACTPPNCGRTAEQHDMALFFEDSSVLYWPRTLRAIALAHITDIGDSARLFALAEMAMADGTITAWDSKRYWNLWRPITAIREGNNDGNARTTGDPSWIPLFTTPNYPEYTSGANNLSGAATTMLRNFFGTDEFEFTITSNISGLTLNPRPYHRFSDAADDIVDARVFQGIHFRFGDRVGRRQGMHISNWTFSHFLRPLD